MVIRWFYFYILYYLFYFGYHISKILSQDENDNTSGVKKHVFNSQP